jgi:uncharacterized protein
MLRRVLAIVVALLTAVPARADFWDGFVAYRAGNFEAAHTQWAPLAEQGSVDAQFFLGVMYLYGEGVPQDDFQAAEWIGRAAEQGHAPAQYLLGILYRTGEGVPQNFVESLKWLILAADQGYEPAAETRDLVARHMAPSLKQQARNLAASWLAEHR